MKQKHPTRSIIRLITRAAASALSSEDCKTQVEKLLTPENQDTVQKFIFLECSKSLDFARAVRAQHLAYWMPPLWRARALAELEPSGQNPLFPEHAKVKAEDISPLFPSMAF